MDTVNQMCLSTLPGYAPRGTRDRAALASLAVATPLADDLPGGVAPLLVILLAAVLVWPVAIVSWLGRARRASRAG